MATVTEMQKMIKDSVVPCLLESGIMCMETTQIDNYKWVVKVEIEGEPRYAEISMTAKKADYDEDSLSIAVQAYADKVAAAEQRAAERAAKRAEKAAAKAVGEKGEKNLAPGPQEF